MKHLLKNATIFVALVLTVAFTGCENLSSNDDGNSQSKLDAPTNLVINSMTGSTFSCDVNITFNYDGKTGLDGATYGILGYATTNDSSQAIYDMYDSQVTVEVGENTRTAFIQGWTPVPETKYYFWLKVISAAYNVSDSSWSKVAEFTYTK